MNRHLGADGRARLETTSIPALKWTILALAGFWVWGCSGTPEQVGKDPAAIVQRAIEGHGGMENWNQLRDVTWRETVIRFSKDPETLGEPTDTAVRTNYYKKASDNTPMFRIEQEVGSLEHVDESFETDPIMVDGPLVVGFDGEEVWYQYHGVLDTSERAQRNARFLTTAFYYWFSLPFKLADPGVRLRWLGEETRDGQVLDKVEVTFNPGVGANWTDYFIYFFDQETGRINNISYQRGGRADRALRWAVWTDYVEIDGVWKEGLRVFYVHRNGDKNTERRFEYFQVNSGLDDDLFLKPESGMATAK